ncbi:MAG: hypothetical protein WDA08_05450 [Weeksellaceae bacterium]
MKKIILLCCIFNFIACSQKTETTEEPAPEIIESKVELPEKTTQFLWFKNEYNEEILDSIPYMRINNKYAQSMTDAEKAAIGYVATFIGNECEWDGGYTDDNTNLKCKILTALDLGYQCSEQHLGFLRSWFKNDEKVLEELSADNCPIIPNTATFQNSFNRIDVTTKGNEIIVAYQATDFNMQDGSSNTWKEIDYFQVFETHLNLVKKERVE